MALMAQGGWMTARWPLSGPLFGPWQSMQIGGHQGLYVLYVPPGGTTAEGSLLRGITT